MPVKRLSLIEARLREDRTARRTTLALVSGIVLISSAWFLLWAWASAGPWVFSDEIGNYVRHLRPFAADHPWILYVPLWSRSSRWLATASADLVRNSRSRLARGNRWPSMIVGQAHVSYRFTYTEGDVAVDMLMYSQASPDVERVMDDLGEIRASSGGEDIAIWYDTGTSWPFQWYLRDYPNRRFYGTTIDSPPNAEVVLISQDNWARTTQC